MNVGIKMYAFTFDCPDPEKLAQFYAALLGWEVVYSDESFVALAAPGVKQGESPGLLFQRSPEYQPPVWPPSPGAQQQMAHLDIAVADLDQAIEHAKECGAGEAATQPSDGMKVMLDPIGHPFCLFPMPDVFNDAQ